MRHNDSPILGERVAMFNFLKKKHQLRNDEFVDVLGQVHRMKTFQLVTTNPKFHHLNSKEVTFHEFDDRLHILPVGYGDESITTSPIVEKAKSWDGRIYSYQTKSGSVYQFFDLPRWNGLDS